MSNFMTDVTEALRGRYSIERELNKGGMATVYLAQDLKHRRKVALKVFRPEFASALGADRFLREIETTAGLRHPGVLPLYDSGHERGVLFYVMPHVDGGTLRDLLDREKQLPLEDVLRIVGEVADALSYAHDHGVIHRDIKPENILLENGRAVVADFGIAHAVNESGGAKLTQTGAVLGTPLYMSPEQANADSVDPRSDLYSLGCVAYEMLVGAPPFSGPTGLVVIARHALDPVPSIRTARPGVPPQVAAAIERALAKTPADRFATIGDWSEALAKQASNWPAPPSDGPAPSSVHPGATTTKDQERKVANSKIFIFCSPYSLRFPESLLSTFPSRLCFESSRPGHADKPVESSTMLIWPQEVRQNCLCFVCTRFRRFPKISTHGELRILYTAGQACWSFGF